MTCNSMEYNLRKTETRKDTQNNNPAMHERRRNFFNLTVCLNIAIFQKEYGTRNYINA